MSATAAQPDPAAATGITLNSDLIAIRHGLARLFGMQPLCDLGDEGRGIAEIVLAEVLNNVVEHAYGALSGEIRVVLSRNDSEILCQIRDQGRPMPTGLPAPGQSKPLVAGEDLPEGGFGWFLIRTLAHDLSYARDGGDNVLSFRLDAL